MSRQKKPAQGTSHTENSKKDNSPKVYQRDKIDFDLKINQRYALTENQKKVLATCLDKQTKCVFIDGLYGTSKTYICCLAALELLNSKRVDQLIYLRNPVESSTTGKIGFLKGTIEEKMDPYNGPLNDKLQELLSNADIKRLNTDGRVCCMPVGFVRGHSWNCKVIIVDEASSMTWDDLFLILTRCGEFTKIFFIGDSENQNDIGAKAGFKKIFDMFNDDESKDFGIHAFELKDIQDIVRSELLKYVMVKAGLIKKDRVTKTQSVNNRCSISAVFPSSTNAFGSVIEEWTPMSEG
jgi:phosphate starvation-inducible PhoH-like protein